MKNKHSFFISIAKVVSTASYCEKQKVGAIIVKNANIITFGYNGTPSGFDNTCEISGVTKPEVLHAESNAIAKCASSLSSSEGADMYVTLSPCFNCAKMIIQAGIKNVYYLDEYVDLSGIYLLKKAGVHVEKII